MKTRFAAERCIDAPAAVVYHCLADYREHHRPGGFLPPAFQQLEITRGGVGAGTEYRFVMAVGGRRRAVSTSVSEPVPEETINRTAAFAGLGLLGLGLIVAVILLLVIVFALCR